MADVVVTPEHLDTLATTQDKASTQAASAASAASDLEVQVWVTHGVASGASNVAFTKAASARQAAGEAMSKGSTELAKKLRTAKNVYQSTDDESGKNLNKQVLDG
ncbi:MULTISPECIES: ESX-1 secretion-associated protein [unclassified Mycobacterium]|uniref:ESX-1 secretion-associated protein n=1 Tax=unclassified Mycobacterium TaxID=2642494 RepID=UPI00096CA33A|nr:MULTISPECIES: ESX-1 secretion-associated protein [unclassified Mycobacterium]OMC15306.1 hypothetical protein A5736_01615 [Mycobacterium sp. SP-6446]OMC54027.1 hypothetical protein A5747_17655 [Mycobacterium sp. IS-836]